MWSILTFAKRSIFLTKDQKGSSLVLEKIEAKKKKDEGYSPTHSCNNCTLAVTAI